MILDIIILSFWGFCVFIIVIDYIIIKKILMVIFINKFVFNCIFFLFAGEYK